MTYEHPHAVELWALAEQMSNRANVREEFKGRLRRLLAIYARHGRFSKDTLDADLYDWARQTYRACANNNASEGRKRAMQLLGFEGIFHSYAPKTRYGDGAHAEPGDRIVSGKLVFPPDMLAEMKRLAPPNYQPCREEEMVETFFWGWLWVWRDHVGNPARPPMGTGLTRFRDLALRMRKASCLTVQATELIDLLEACMKQDADKKKPSLKVLATA